MIVEGVESIGISQSRMISKEVSEQPYEAKVRAIVIDGADTMTPEATNALLKTLEEPPPNNVFFLISSSEKDILLTIRSRCVRVPFSPLNQSDVEEYFANVLRMEKEKARLISSQSYGSIGLGLFWTEDDNLLLRRKLGELITGKKRSFVESTAISERLSKNNRGLNLYLSFLLSFFRDLYLAAHERGSAQIINSDLRDLMDHETADLPWIERSIKKIQETMFNMRYNINKWLLFENMLLHIMR
jgi:DNA polymerase-3 subunit delta'